MTWPAGLHVSERSHDGPLVVLVHGSLDRGAAFARLRSELDEYRIVTYDRRGYGKSIPDPPVAVGASFDEHVDDLVAVLEAAGASVHAPALVLGHSYGGDVVMAAAIRRPDLFAGIAVFEPPMPWLPIWREGSAGAAVVAAGDRGDEGAVAEVFLRRMIGDERWEGLSEKTKSTRRLEGPALLAELRTLRADPPPFDPAAVRVPIVVGSGEHSKPHQRAGAAHLAQQHGVAVHVVAGGAHFSHTTHPADLAAMVRAIPQAG